VQGSRLARLRPRRWSLPSIALLPAGGVAIIARP